MITRDPATALHRPEAEEHHRRALTAEETAAALAVAQEHPRGLLLLILYYTGLRIGEALGLQWDDIDFTQHVLHVRRDIDQFGVGDVKTANALRTVPVPDRLYSALAEALPSDAGGSFIFQGRNGSFWSKSAMRSAWYSMMGAIYEKDPSVEHKELRITRNTHGKGSILTPHYFRHNYASYFIQRRRRCPYSAKMAGPQRPSHDVAYLHPYFTAERTNRCRKGEQRVLTACIKIVAIADMQCKNAKKVARKLPGTHPKNAKSPVKRGFFD